MKYQAAHPRSSLRLWYDQNKEKWNAAVQCRNIVRALEFMGLFARELAKEDSAEQDEWACGILNECCREYPDIETYVTNSFLSRGGEYYREGQLRRAERFFRIAAAHGRNTGMVHILRRGETADAAACSAVDMLKMLRNEVQQQDGFAMVNMALVLALLLGQESDWILAENLIRHLQDGTARAVLDWWKRSAGEGDTEGVLVVYLLRHCRKASDAAFYNEHLLSWYLSRKLPGFPAWLQVQDEVTLEKIADNMDEELSQEYLTEYLSAAPRNRHTAEELLKAIRRWDIFQLYAALTEDYVEFLTREELENVRKRMDQLFDMPDALPAE